MNPHGMTQLYVLAKSFHFYLSILYTRDVPKLVTFSERTSSSHQIAPMFGRPYLTTFNKTGP